MRASQYTITAPMPDGRKHLLVHGFTGAVDVVEAAVVDFLSHPDGATNIPGETIQRLVARGYLTERSREEERAHAAAVARAFHRRHLAGSAFVFVPTFGCQLRCGYCYESALTHSTGPLARARMTPAHVEAAYAAIDAIVAGPNKRRPKEITLYGGEPLMRGNLAIVRRIVETGVARGFRFNAVTNGFDLDAYRDLLGPERIALLQITIDGTGAVHDRRRPAAGGQPTFQRICDAVQLALDRGCQVAVRTNVDRDNRDCLRNLDELYRSRGWSTDPGFFPYAYVTHDHVPDKMMRPTELLDAVEPWASGPPGDSHRRIRVDFGVAQVMYSLLRGGTVPGLRPYFCGASIGSYIFGPDSYVYTCWDEVGREEGRIGRYSPSLSWNEERSRGWLERHVGNIPECTGCAYLMICGGGCGIQARNRSGSLLRPYCHEFKETFQRVAPRVAEGWIRERERPEGASP